MQGFYEIHRLDGSIKTTCKRHRDLSHVRRINYVLRAPGACRECVYEEAKKHRVYGREDLSESCRIDNPWG